MFNHFTGVSVFIVVGMFHTLVNHFTLLLVVTVVEMFHQLPYNMEGKIWILIGWKLLGVKIHSWKY